jgi:hypothetical protein
VAIFETHLKSILISEELKICVGAKSGEYDIVTVLE